MRQPISTQFLIRSAREQIDRAFEPVYQLKDDERPPTFVRDAFERLHAMFGAAASMDDVRDLVTAFDGIVGFAKRHSPPPARAALRVLDGVLDRLHKQLGEAQS